MSSEESIEIIEKFYRGIQLGDLNMVKRNLPRKYINAQTVDVMFTRNLYRIYECKNVEVVKYLVEECGVKLERLYPSCSIGNFDVVRYLISKRSFGDTEMAFYGAFYNKHYNIAILLAESGLVDNLLFREEARNAFWQFFGVKPENKEEVISILKVLSIHME